MEKSQLLNKLRHTIRTFNYSIRTEEAYVNWVKNFILFHNKKHPSKLAEKEISDYLIFLAVKKNVAASTQNQALSAIIFFYSNVLKIEIQKIDNLIRAKRPKKLPVVFTKDESSRLLLQMQGVPWLVANLLYGSGLRLMECIRLRVKDIDFGYNQILVRDGKGHKDRRTMLPTN
jgi:integrase